MLYEYLLSVCINIKDHWKVTLQDNFESNDIKGIHAEPKLPEYLISPPDRLTDKWHIKYAQAGAVKATTKTTQWHCDMILLPPVDKILQGKIKSSIIFILPFQTHSPQAIKISWTKELHGQNSLSPSWCFLNGF